MVDGVLEEGDGIFGIGGKVAIEEFRDGLLVEELMIGVVGGCGGLCV